MHAMGDGRWPTRRRGVAPVVAMAQTPGAPLRMKQPGHHLTWHRSLVGHAMYCRIHSYTKGYDTINRWISFSYIYNRPYDPINLYAEEERETGTFNTSTVNIQNLVPGCKP